MDISTILTLAFTTGVVTTGINQGIVWLRDHRHERRIEKHDARYLAVQLVVILEKYASQCIYRIWWDDEMITHGQIENINHELPKLAAYPNDPACWKSLHSFDPSLTERALLIPNKIESSENASNFESTFEGNRIAVIDDVAIIGMEALTLARELRERFKMDSSSIKHTKTLERKFAEIQHQRPPHLPNLPPSGK